MSRSRAASRSATACWPLTNGRRASSSQGVTSRPVPSLMRGFSAPVNVTIALSDDDLAFLMHHDGDLFNRWQASNRYATRAVLSLLGAKKPKAVVVSKAAKLAEALRYALRDTTLDDAYKAELLRLPAVTDVAREKATKVDHAAIYEAHRSFSRVVADSLVDELRSIYAHTSSATTYHPDAQSAGRRALRNAALTLLSVRADGRGSRTARSPLSPCDEHDGCCSRALSDRQRRHAGTQRDPRKLLQALVRRSPRNRHVVRRPGSIASARNTRRGEGTLPPSALQDYHAEQGRALIGTFATANPLQFNRADGAGYDFLADKVLEIDPLNPQVAARMLGAFRSYRSLETKRKSLAKTALKRVAAAQRISRDCHEIVSRMLDE